ncbi:MAG: purine-nucleoside phosphorylase [Ignavibacteria bacterium]|nr:purine-nucleoside phosphorylase [Bacteroidota bacterium]MSQ46324.1 purine-nucleoside phosphorylase [Ignavibacteria bacterium]
MTSDLLKKIDDAINFIKTKTSIVPEVGIILGTGLGSLVNEITSNVVLNYKDIPHFPLSTVESHQGKLHFGKLSEKNVIVMQGRFHFYEGYSMQQITFPVRVMKKMGIKTLIISNAAGGVNPSYKKGDIMIIKDHINLLGDNPLIGQNDDELGPRFPDMSEPYSQNLIKLSEEIASQKKIKTQTGVFTAMSGPTLETRAEYKFLQKIGTDAVGMSTIPEVIVAVHMSLQVLGFSIITDECDPEKLQVLNLEDVISVATKTEPSLREIIKGVISQL